MKQGYTINHVPDLAASQTFSENAVGRECRFVHERGACGERDTDATTLPFTAPDDKPGAQTVSYGRCPDGILVDSYTPIAV